MELLAGPKMQRKRIPSKGVCKSISFREFHCLYRFETTLKDQSNEKSRKFGISLLHRRSLVVFFSELSSNSFPWKRDAGRSAEPSKPRGQRTPNARPSSNPRPLTSRTRQIRSERERRDRYKRLKCNRGPRRVNSVKRPWNERGQGMQQESRGES